MKQSKKVKTKTPIGFEAVAYYPPVGGPNKPHKLEFRDGKQNAQPGESASFRGEYKPGEQELRLYFPGASDLFTNFKGSWISLTSKGDNFVIKDYAALEAIFGPFKKLKFKIQTFPVLTLQKAGNNDFRILAEADIEIDGGSGFELKAKRTGRKSKASKK